MAKALTGLPTKTTQRMHYPMDTNIREEVSTALRTAKEAFEALASVLNTAMSRLNDVIEENQRLHDANNKLVEDNKRYFERCNELETQVWSERRAKDQAVNEKDQASRDSEREISSLKGELEVARKTIEVATEECRKLREIILNVATSVDSIINPKPPAPEVAKPVDPPTQSYAGDFGNPLPVHSF